MWRVVVALILAMKERCLVMKTIFPQQQVVVTDPAGVVIYNINDVLNRQQNKPRNPTTTVPKKETILYPVHTKA